MEVLQEEEKKKKTFLLPCYLISLIINAILIMANGNPKLSKSVFVFSPFSLALIDRIFFISSLMARFLSEL